MVIASSSPSRLGLWLTYYLAEANRCTSGKMELQFRSNELPP